MSNEPQDIKRGWLSVARRAQSISKTGSLALISVTVLVNQEGEPIFWLEPSRKKIEPRRSSGEIAEIFMRLMEDRQI